MIVRVNLRAGRILDQKQRLMRGAEGAIDKHLDGDARGGIKALHLRRAAGAGQSRFIKMADRRSRIRNCRLVGEKSIGAVFDGRGWGACISSHRAVPLPPFFHEWDTPVGINPKLPGTRACTFSPI